ncbi:hypothetical protein HHK36_001405 [Tetracentron sinense]|uniref:NAC domain-containing protein n=1 Tax=Tetracentron sinense TaxID=13715 RepID=A0A835A3L7_TETSI|nr:hypothetical protein HHK36_001405 [Tetracentron sinense]
MAVLSLESYPLGFRFRPTDQELVNHYLRSKINGKDSDVQVIPEVDICKWEPWDLPGLSLIKSDDPEWFFFCPRDWKYTKGHRSNRATQAGYWKATGKDREIKSRPSGMNLIGMKKTLVFYRGRAPNGERSNWIMHEYRATEKELDGTEAGQVHNALIALVALFFYLLNFYPLWIRVVGSDFQRIGLWSEARGAFVLCRLFKKPEENTEISICDEVEPTGLSPTASKSSLDSTPSKLALVHATTASDMQVGKQPAGIDLWLADKFDNMTSDTVPIEILCNSFIASDVEDQTEELTATEETKAKARLFRFLQQVDQQLEEDLKLFYEPSFEPLDYMVLSPQPSQMQMELGPSRMDSLFANDFGNPNGVQFQDGKSEDDVSITEFLNAVLNNQDEYSCEESTSQQNSVVDSETIECGRTYMSMAGPWRKDSESSSDRDTEVVQAQVRRKPCIIKLFCRFQTLKFEPSAPTAQTTISCRIHMALEPLRPFDIVYDPEVEVPRYNEHVDMKDSFMMKTARGSYRNQPIYDGEYQRGNMSLLQNDSVRLDASSVMDPVDDIFIEESSSEKNSGNNSGLVGTGIKIRTRQPQNHLTSHSFVTQGVAPRRILLQRELSCRSFYCGKVRQFSCSADDHEAKPVIEDGDATEHTSIPDEPQKNPLFVSDKNSKITQVPNTKLRLRLRRDGAMDSDRNGPSVSLEAPRTSRYSSFSPLLIVSGTLVTILLIIFIGFMEMP